MHGNVIWSAATGAMGLVRADDGERCWTDGEQILGGANWVETGTSPIPAGWSGTLSGAAPGFEDVATLALRPAAGSPLLDAVAAAPPTIPAFPFPGGLWPPPSEPAAAALPGDPAWPRAWDADCDVGAFERPGPLFVDGFEGQSTARWSATFP
jgi:hypothetical protein